MKLKCGVHADLESDTRPIFVCHHCGVPVCEDHGWVMLTDDAFDESADPLPRAAMHCPECATYHPRSAGKRRGWGIIKPRPAAGQEAPAPGQGPVYGPEAPRPRPYPGYTPPQAPNPGYSPPQQPYPQQPYPPQQPYQR